MDRSTANRDEFRRYLLGEMDAEASAEVEISLADDETYEQFLAAEQALVDEYSRGTLSQRDSELFEGYYLVHAPEGLQKAALATASLRLAPGLIAQRGAGTDPNPESRSWVDQIRDFLRRLKVPKSAFAAVILLISIAAVIYILRLKSAELEQRRQVDDLRKNLGENSKRMEQLKEELQRLQAETGAQQKRDSETITKLQDELAARAKVEEELRAGLGRHQAGSEPALFIPLSPFSTKGTEEGVTYKITGKERRVRLSLQLRGDGREYGLYQIILNNRLVGKNLRAKHARLRTSVSITISSEQFVEGINKLELLRLNPDGQYKPVEGYVLRLSKH